MAKRWAPYNSRARGKVLMSVLPVPACSAVSMAIVCCLLLISSCSRGCCLLPAPALLPLAVDLIPAPSPLTTTLLQGVASHKRGFLLHVHKRFDIWGWGTYYKYVFCDGSRDICCITQPWNIRMKLCVAEMPIPFRSTQ